MAIPAYTTDLVDWIADGDIAAWGELTGAVAGGAPDEADTESSLQGTNTVSQITNTIDPFSMCRILGASVDLTNKVAFVWHGHGVATALETYANNGLGVAFATSLANWESFTVAGIDTPPFPYGKWINSAVDPAFATADRTNGTPPAVTAIFGIGSIGELTQVVARGQPHVCDIIRTGRGEARFAGGEVANYATFTGFATQNDTTTNRWGLIQSTTGGYLWKGLMVLGHGALVDFRDSNKNIYVQDTRKVASTFNIIEVRNASSNVEWTNISILSTGTVSRGNFECIDNATVTKDGCSFTDMGTFIYLSNSNILNTTYRRCDVVTTGGGNFTNVLFANSFATASAKSAELGNFVGCEFISDGSNHAVELTSIGAGSMSWDGNTLTSYVTGVAASPVIPTSTGNEAIYVNVVTASDLTINVAGGATVPSIRVGASFTGNVNVVASSNITVSGLKDNTEVRVMTAGTDTELTGIDIATAGTLNNRSFSFALPSGTNIDIFIVSKLYENIEIYTYVVPSVDATLPQQQRFDRVYKNI